MQKHFLLLALLLLVLPALSFAQNKKNMDAAKDVEALERQRFAAQVKKDYALLNKFFAADLIYTHGDGHQDDKTSYIQSIRDGKSQYGKIDVEALNVRGYNDGQSAVVNGTIVITSPPKADGQTTSTRFKYVVVQVKDPKKGWQVVLWQSQKQAEVKG